MGPPILGHTHSDIAAHVSHLLVTVLANWPRPEMLKSFCCENYGTGEGLQIA